MQIKGLHKNIYKLASYSLSQEKSRGYHKHYEEFIWKWDKLKKSGLSAQECQEIVGISRATYYRYRRWADKISRGMPPASRRPRNVRKRLWGEAEKQLVLKVRRENPTYGKNKITIILRRDYKTILSESTVGRILKYLMQRGILVSLTLCNRKRKRKFKKHAKPWTYGMKGYLPGQMVQIDHMSVNKNGYTGKHFQAWDPLSKFMHAGLYHNASSKTAKRFLLELIDKAPFKIRTIQVDGGSEFMKEFEQACANLNIPLYVLPPKKPKYNGGVERGNRTFREEFYNQELLGAESFAEIQNALSKALQKYNTFRPHFSLKGLTPMEYLKTNYRKVLLSHMY